MVLYVLNQAQETIDLIDTFESLIWCERYNDVGDFEFYSPIDESKFQNLKTGNYLYRKDTERFMRIDTVEIKTDVENGDRTIVTGSTLEDLLSHYVIYPAITLSGNFQTAVRSLINSCIIAPTISARRIPNFIFRNSTDSAVTSLSLSNEVYYCGENLLDALKTLCAEKNVGFRILPNGTNGYAFELYMGKDRSYNQEVNPWVAFTPKIGNFLSSDYLESDKNYRSTCYVIAEITKTITTVLSSEETLEQQVDVPLELEVSTNSSDTGVNRREIFLDMGKLDTEVESEAISQMQEKGKEELTKYVKNEDFEGVVDSSRQYVYGKDYFIGDVVSVVNQYGREGTSRISEVLYSLDTTGERIIPTFTSVKK